MKITALEEVKNDLTTRITSADPELLIQFPISTYIEHLDQSRVYGQYHYLPSPINNFYQQNEQQLSQSLLEDYHKLLLLYLIENIDSRLAAIKVPETIQTLCYKECKRIFGQMRTNPKGFYLYTNDYFVKDLAICRLKLLPCGAQLVDVYAGIPRSILFSGGIMQLLKGLLFFIFNAKGFKPFYALHTHPGGRMLREFTPSGWNRCYMRISELLELNPEIKGMSYSTWWTDPKLETISPNLRFLRELPKSNGAQIFRVGTDESSIENATKLSEERRQLYEEGKYIPTNYMLVWSRKDLMKWAAQQKKSGF